MGRLVLLLYILANVLLCTFTAAKSLVSYSYPFPFVDRYQWGAEPPTSEAALTAPVQYVIIHHSYEPGVCVTREECEGAMKFMQRFHQIDHGWADIGYNFAVGGEGSVYEGRGWSNVGAHAAGFNAMSIGICIIGDWRNDLPPGPTLDAVKKLISTGVELGYISPEYVLIGHRQASETECPGGALFHEISSWERFQENIE